MFPARFHEPYYRQYAIDDLDRVFRDAGLDAVEHSTAFLSKMMVRRKVGLNLQPRGHAAVDGEFGAGDE